MKSKVTLIIVFLCRSMFLEAQVDSLELSENWQQERINENQEGSSDQGVLLELSDTDSGNPVNINEATFQEIVTLLSVSEKQVQALIEYRKLLGPLSSIYELQAIPAWDIETIQRVKSRITVVLASKRIVPENIKRSDCKQRLLFRVSRGIERPVGYRTNVDGQPIYKGSQAYMLLNYRLNIRKEVQLGFTAEKDPGEQFFKGAQNKGFDFYGFHAVLQRTGLIRQIILGDYTVNFGQGLIHWQGLALGKSTDLLSVKRQAQTLKFYGGSGEQLFNRGIGITFSHKRWQTNIFVSLRKRDARLVLDSLHPSGFISSYQTSGLHRTTTEQKCHAVQNQFSYGASVKYNFPQGHLAVNGVGYRFKYPFIPEKSPENLFRRIEKIGGAMSVDYSVTKRNKHLFGEFAWDLHAGISLVQGLLMSVAKDAELSILFRKFSKQYQSVQANAFSENSLVQNETGIFAAIVLRPISKWQIALYADFYQFPWLKYRVHAPSIGSDFSVQVNFKPQKKSEWQNRFTWSNRNTSSSSVEDVINTIKPTQRMNFRSTLLMSMNSQVTVAGRVEWVHVKTVDNQPVDGFLMYIEGVFSMKKLPLKSSVRIQFVDSESYETRVYAYERDLRFAYNLTANYGQGIRYYLNFQYHLSKKFHLGIKISQSIFSTNLGLGSGQDQLEGSRRTAVRLQFIAEI